MNAIQVQCSQCKRRFAAKPHLAGKRVKCPGCGSAISVPDVNVIRSVQVTCSACLTDFLAESSDVGSQVACPSCGTITTAGGTSGDSPFLGGNPFGDVQTPTASPLGAASHQSTFQLPVHKSRFGAMVGSTGPNPVVQYGISGVAVLAGLLSLVICLVSGHPVAGALLFFVGLAMAGCGFAFPPPKGKSSQGSSLSVGTIVASAAGVGLFIALILLARGGGVQPQPGAPPSAVIGLLVTPLLGLLLLAGAMIGFVYLVVHFGFSRPAAAYYSLSAIALSLAWGISAPKIVPRDDLPRTAQETRRPSVPPTGLAANDLASAPSRAEGIGGTSANPFRESSVASGARYNATERIKELMANGNRPSGEERREIIEGTAKDQVEETKESGGTDAIDENPFTESPFQPSGTNRSSSSMAGTAGSANKDAPTNSSRGSARDKQVQRLIDQITGDNGFAKRDALKELAKIDPPAEAEDETRQAVIKVLNAAAIDEDHFTQKEAIETLGKWGDKSSVDVLLSLLADQRSRSLNKELYRALGQLKDAQSAMPVAERLGDFFDRDAAEACLREMGSIAEDALLIVAYSSDGEISMRAVRLLGDVGTEKCLTTLREALRSRNPAVKEAGRMALRKVRLRQNSTEEEEEEE